MKPTDEELLAAGKSSGLCGAPVRTFAAGPEETYAGLDPNDVALELAVRASGQEYTKREARVGFANQAEILALWNAPLPTVSFSASVPPLPPGAVGPEGYATTSPDKALIKRVDEKRVYLCGRLLDSVADASPVCMRMARHTGECSPVGAHGMTVFLEGNAPLRPSGEITVMMTGCVKARDLVSNFRPGVFAILD